ncbi:MAG: glycosyltransferase family 4 protein [Thermoguttaceae bacterium]|nr:glycosyltransferase family 4 protein [Thermoguttaceae bacterium]
MKKILFSSYHNYLDQGSGAAISARSLLLDLVGKGWSARTITGSFFDDPRFARGDFYATLKKRGLLVDAKRTTARVNDQKVDFDLLQFDDFGVSSKVFLAPDAFAPNRPCNYISRATGLAFLKLFVDEIRAFRPDYYLTYGGYWAARLAARAARRENVKNVFYLCNFAYDDKDLFKEFDSIIVPSEFSRAFYQKRLGIESRVVPSLIDESKIVASHNTEKYLTFVNPALEKGLYFFAGIARELARIRPDVPVLIVEGRSKITSRSYLEVAGMLPNVSVMNVSLDPRNIYSQTRVLLVPSLWRESFGRVVVEAAMNGIPVVCSDRGALPEVATDKSCVLSIPSRFTPNSQIVPDQEEVAPWVEKIIELWDNQELRREIGRRSRIASQRFRSASVSEQTESFFLELAGKSDARKKPTF